MDINKYEAFLHIVAHGSMSRAAEKLGYTQSGMTHMMHALEAEMGFPLLKRNNKGVSLTPEGEQIYPIIQNICNIENRLRQECALIRGYEIGHVRIGSFSSISIQWLPQILSRFQKLYPHIRVETLEGSAMQLEDWLAAGRIDLCLFSLFRDRNLEGFEIMQDPFYAVLPPAHPLTELDVVPLKLLAREPFVMLTEEGGIDRDLAAILKEMHIRPKSTFSSNYEYAVLSMVAHGLGVCLMPGLLMKNYTVDVVLRPIDPPYSRSLGIATRSLKELSPAMKRFIACVREVLLPEEV